MQTLLDTLKRRWTWWALPLLMGGVVMVRGASELQPIVKPVEIAEDADAAESDARSIVQKAGIVVQENDAVVAGEPVEAAETSKEVKIRPKPVFMQRGIGSYLAARMAARQRDVMDAAHYYTQAIKDNPQDMILKRDAVRAFLLAGDVTQASSVAQELVKAGDKSQIAFMLDMIESVKVGKTEQARKAMEQLEPVGLLSLTKPLFSAWLEIARTKTVPKIAVNSKLRQTSFFDGFVHAQKALMYDMLGQDEAARDYYAKAVQDPKELSYRMLQCYMDFLIRHEQLDKAKTAFQAWLLVNPENVLVQGMPVERVIADMHAPVSSGTAAQRPVMTVSDGVAELMFATANMLYGGEDGGVETLLYLRLALFLRPDFPHAQLLLANVLEDMQKPQQALDVYESIAKDVVVLRRAAIRRAFVLDAMDRGDEALDVLDALAKEYPQSTDIYVTKGDVLRKHDRFADAAQSYTQAIAAAGKIEEQHWPLFYVRGISYERSNDWALAEKDLRKALALSPDQPDVLNYLGYSLLLQGQNLVEAKEMLGRAVTDRPDDPHILDSMGWAHYVSGEYKQAVELLEQAAELMPGDATVNDHLGDALWRVGRKTEAKFQWQRALTFNPEPEVKDLIERKIEEGLPVITPQAKR